MLLNTRASGFGALLGTKIYWVTKRGGKLPLSKNISRCAGERFVYKNLKPRVWGIPEGPAQWGPDFWAPHLGRNEFPNGRKKNTTPPKHVPPPKKKKKTKKKRRVLLFIFFFGDGRGKRAKERNRGGGGGGTQRDFQFFQSVLLNTDFSSRGGTG